MRALIHVEKVRPEGAAAEAAAAAAAVKNAAVTAAAPKAISAPPSAPIVAWTVAPKAGSPTSVAVSDLGNFKRFQPAVDTSLNPRTYKVRT